MINLDDYDYPLPSNLIATKPAVPRDSSRLFIYDTTTDNIEFDYFYNLDRYLPPKSFLVLNNTKVLPARIELRKKTGGKVKVLFLVNELNENKKLNLKNKNDKSKLKNNLIRAYVDRQVKLGERLYFNSNCYITAINQQAHIFTLQFDFSRTTLFKLLEEKGTMPIPLYIKNSPLTEKELRNKYQTIFARALDSAGLKAGSTAAPTASLHFTDQVFKSLKKKGIPHHFITLHVGLGTFAPVTEENIEKKRLHDEYYEISSEILQCIKSLKQNQHKLVSVGTTVTRTLESIGCSITNNQSPITKNTNLFIYPPYDFKMVDMLITNFHLPKSSLMMLVEAFLQFKGAKRKLIDLYKMAIKEKFRFYSFGDVMLIK